LARRATPRGLPLAIAEMLSEILAARQSWEVKLPRRGIPLRSLRRAPARISRLRVSAPYV
jgi:hypothetical protein